MGDVPNEKLQVERKQSGDMIKKLHCTIPKFPRGDGENQADNLGATAIN